MNARIELPRSGGDEAGALLLEENGRDEVRRLTAEVARLAVQVETLAAEQVRARVQAQAAIEALEHSVRERRTLAEAIEQSGDSIGIARPDGRGIWLNEAGLQLVGLVSSRSVEQLNVTDFFAPADRARVRDEVLATVARKGHWEGELFLRHFTSGERIAVWYSIFEVHESDGQVIALGTVARDIRTQKALEEERARLLEREHALRIEAEAAGRARDEFLAMLGHEMRNPLAPIATAVQIMRLRGDHHPKERQVIERQVAHLSRLVDDLLDVARVAHGRIDLQREPLEMAAIVSTAIEIASPLLEQRSHELSIEVPREGLLVDGDPVRLAQVVSNLLTNAAKYTQKRGHIAVRAVLEAGQVVLTVVDDGPGLPKDLLPRVFDLFVQGRQTLDRAQGGLGLGLALVKNLIALHGGSVAARNRDASGSEFEVRLPALAPPLPGERAVVRLVERRPPHASRRVLIVDDNIEAAELTATLLRGHGHEVLVAHDGPQALEALRSFAAETCVLDLGLPVMDGFELARKIRELQPQGAPRLIAVTGYGQDHDRELAQGAGFDVHLTKPVEFAALSAAVEG